MQSSARIIIALAPPTKKKTPIPHQVLHADDLVICAQAEVAPDPLALLLAQRSRSPEQAPDRVVGEAHADQKADDPAGIRQQQRDVVLVWWRSRTRTSGF